MKIFCLLDVKANHFLQPFPERSVVDALRGFETAVNDPDKRSTVAQYPDDFALCEIGEFDMATGVLHAHPNPINLGSGRTLVRTAVMGSQSPLPGINRPESVELQQ